MDVLKYLTNCKVYSTAEQSDNEAEWLAARSRGIGGSDVGAICGVSPFTSARQIYLSKTGQFPDSMQFSAAAQERMRFGHLLEPIVADEYARRTGAKLVEVHATLQHKDFSWALANVDRLIVDDEGKPIGILECKTTGEYNNDDWENGDLLLSYIYQLNWYMWVLDIKKGAFACLVGGNKFYEYEIFRNDELLNEIIIPAATKFWNENVKLLIEPEMQAADTEFANTVFSAVVKNSEKTFEDDTTNELAATVFECKAKIKELTGIMEEAQNRLKDRLQDTEIGYTKDYTIKWSPRTQMRVSSDLLKTNFPEIYKQVLYPVNFRAMSIKGGF